MAEYYNAEKNLLFKPVYEGGYFDSSTGLILQNKKNLNEGMGDAVWRTSLACIAMSLEGDLAKAISLLNAINGHCWDNSGNPIRYPGLDDFTKNGKNLGPQPLTIDGFLPLMAACYLTWKLGVESHKPKIYIAAFDTLKRYFDYLLAHQWRLQVKYSDDDIKNNIRRSGDSAIGPESFMLLPPNIYTLRFIIATMGNKGDDLQIPEIDTSAEIAQLAADYLAHYVGNLLRPVLEFIHLGFSWDIQPGAGWAPALNIRGSINVGIPGKVIEQIISMIETQIREGIRIGVALKLQVGELLLAAVKNVRGEFELPFPLIPNDWVDLFAAILFPIKSGPLNSGKLAIEIMDLITIFYYQHVFGGKNDPKNFYSVHLAFWPLYLMVTQNFEINFLRAAISSFYESIKNHRMGLFAWLARDKQTVASLLESFSSRPEWRNFDYMWQETIVSQERDVASAPDKMSPRIDYMILYNLDRMESPIDTPIDYQLLRGSIFGFGQILYEKFASSVPDLIRRPEGLSIDSIDTLGNTFKRIYKDASYAEKFVGAAAEKAFGNGFKAGERIFNKIAVLQCAQAVFRDGALFRQSFDELLKRADSNASAMLEIGAEGLANIQERIFFFKDGKSKLELLDRAASTAWNGALRIVQILNRNVIEQQITNLVSGRLLESFFHDAAIAIDSSATAVTRLYEVGGKLKEELIKHFDGGTTSKIFDDGGRVIGEKILDPLNRVLKDTLGGIGIHLPEIELPPISIKIPRPRWLIESHLEWPQVFS